MRGSKVEFEENLEKLWALGELGKENLERKKRLAQQQQEKKKLGLLSIVEEGSGEQSWRILFTCMSE